MAQLSKRNVRAGEDHGVSDTPKKVRSQFHEILLEYENEELVDEMKRWKKFLLDAEDSDDIENVGAIKETIEDIKDIMRQRVKDKRAGIETQRIEPVSKRGVSKRGSEKEVSE